MERRIKGDVKPTRSNSSNRWMHEHVTDPFVQQAKKLGYRSRASFKIIELDEKYKLFRRGMYRKNEGLNPSKGAAPCSLTPPGGARKVSPAPSGGAIQTGLPTSLTPPQRDHLEEPSPARIRVRAPSMGI